MRPYRKPTHPGEVFREDVLQPLHLTITEAARRLRVNRQTLSAFLNGKVSLSPALAIRIGRATQTTPESWLAMQVKCDLWRAEQTAVDIEAFESTASAF